MVAECVAVEPSMIEIVQTVEILRCELVVSELVVSELVVSELVVAKLIVGGKRIATSVCEIVTGNPPGISVHCVIVTEIMGTAAAHGVTMSAQCMATPPMTHVGQATMEPTMESTAMPATAPTVKPAVKTTKPAMPAPTAAMPAAATAMPAAATAMPAAAATAMPRDCRHVRHDAKRAHRNARCQNSNRSLLHGTFPTQNF